MDLTLPIQIVTMQHLGQTVISKNVWDPSKYLSGCFKVLIKSLEEL